MPSLIASAAMHASAMAPFWSVVMQDNLAIASAGPCPLGTPAERATLREDEQRTNEPLTSLEQARRIAGLAEEKLAQDIVILDMRPVCAYTDFFVVCSGQNPRQTKAIVDEVRYGLKHGDEQVLPHAVEGEREGEWIVADYIDVVLHVFTPKTRDYYGLEQLWDDVPSIEHATAS
jgi:ribosome-associated protein